MAGDPTPGEPSPAGSPGPAPRGPLGVRFARGYILAADGLSELVGRAAGAMTAALVVLVCYQVGARYLFGFSQLWIQELQWQTFSGIFLLGAAYGLRHDRHVRVDVLYTKMGPRSKAWVNLVGTVLFLVPMCVIGISSSTGFVSQSFRVGEGSPNPGGLQMWWIVKSFIVAGLILLLVQGLSFALKAGLYLAGRYPKYHEELSSEEPVEAL